MSKPIRFSGHARDRLDNRGIEQSEVIEAIRTSPWQQIERGRLECRKNFAYGREWNGKHYATKQVRPIFVDEDEIIVITAYAYYF